MKKLDREAEGREGPEEKGPRAEEQPPRKKGGFESLRENLEAIVVAIVLALIIRHFSVEAFEIPTGSMAPTLYGIHVWAECPNCSTEFNIGLQSNSDTGELQVPSEDRLVYWGACPKCKLPHHRAYHDEDEPKARSPVTTGDTFICPYDKVQWQGAPGDFGTATVITEKILGEITCPICWFRYKEVLKADWLHRTGGHKILVDKFAYKIGKPRRWDVIVFQYNRETNYIKRLIGLPGEKIEIRRGDLYVARPDEDFKIERKSARPGVQEVLWTKIHDIDIPEKGYGNVPAWKEVFPKPGMLPSGAWRWDGSDHRWSVNTGTAAEKKIAAIRYMRPIKDFYNYNILYRKYRGAAPEVEVGDKKVAFGARIPREGTGWVGAEIGSGTLAFQVRIPVGKPSPERPATLRRLVPVTNPDLYSADRDTIGGESFSRSVEAAIPLEKVTRVEFEVVDARAAVRIDGVEILAIEYDLEQIEKESPNISLEPKGPNDNTVFLLAGDGAACGLESIRLWRDIYYTQVDRTPFAEHPFGVEKSPVALAAGGDEDEYFACGDNSPASSDGRFWGSIPERNLMGRALLVFWPLWPFNFQGQFIR
jgi:signal peptidase I